jgi:hypothetical protein
MTGEEDASEMKRRKRVSLTPCLGQEVMEYFSFYFYFPSPSSPTYVGEGVQLFVK